MSGLVYIIIVNWNNWKDTLACMESILENGYADFRLLVVDNGSIDSSEERIRMWAIEKGHSVEIIQTGANLGFTGGNNAGLKYALREKDCDYLWILNNDTVIDKNALRALVNCIESAPSIGMAGSKLLYYTEPSKIQNAGGCKIAPCLGNSVVVANNVLDDGSWESPFEPDYINGASLLVKKEVVEKIGLFDENYFLYWEDADWGVRARRAGYKLIYCPESRVFHKEGGTGGKLNPLTDYYWTRNGLYFVKKFYWWYVPLVIGAYFFKFLIVRPLKGQPTNLASFLRGIADFLSGKWNKGL